MLSFGAMKFDLGPRSKVTNAIFTNISESMRDRDYICVEDLQKIT